MTDQGDDEQITVRRAREDDRAALLDVCRASLGWEHGDPNEHFFAWKHDQNSFGPSPMWLALDAADKVLGVRCFMRWRFRSPNGETLDAVRAVDTATHPDARGKGVFTKLTLGALPELEEMGTRFVFNTPNDKSRPGYIKMGWSVVGRVPLGVRPSRLRPRRNDGSTWSGSDKWGVPTAVGLPAEDAFADDQEVHRLLDSLAPSHGICTDRSPEFLRWRYGFEPLGYRVLPVGDSMSDGAVVFRLRQRGGRLDATVCEELLPTRRFIEPAFTLLGRLTGADLIMRAQHDRLERGPFVGVTRLGPLLTWKPLSGSSIPTLDDLDLTYGDLELF